MLYNDEYYMNLALVEAKKAFNKGDVPVGAVIVSNVTHKVISRAKARNALYGLPCFGIYFNHGKFRAFKFIYRP